jgi:hypothetical protein
MRLSFSEEPNEHPASLTFAMTRPGVALEVGVRLARLLPIIREIVADLETLTLAGQRLTMAKVVELIEDRVRELAPFVGARNGHEIKELVARLAEEAEHRYPDVVAFTHGAESLLALLGSLGAGGPLPRSLPLGAGVPRVGDGGVDPGLDPEVDVHAAADGGEREGDREGDGESDGEGDADRLQPYDELADNELADNELADAPRVHGLLGLLSTV